MAHSLSDIYSGRLDSLVWAIQENKRLDSGNYAKAGCHSDRREESQSPLRDLQENGIPFTHPHYHVDWRKPNATPMIYRGVRYTR